MARIVRITLALSAILLIVNTPPLESLHMAMAQSGNEWQFQQITPIDTTGRTTYSFPSISSAGRYIAFLKSITGEGTQSIRVYDNQAGHVIEDIPIPPNDEVERILISPNGRDLILQTHARIEQSEPAITIYDRMTGVFTDLHESASTTNIKVPLSYDGRYLIIHKNDTGQLQLIDRFTGQEFDIFTPSSDEKLTSAAISLNGRWIVYANRTGAEESPSQSRISLFDRVFQTTKYIYSIDGQDVFHISLDGNGSTLAFMTQAADAILLDLSTDPPVTRSTFTNLSNLDLTAYQDRLVIETVTPNGFELGIQSAAGSSRFIIQNRPMKNDAASNGTGERIVFVGEDENSPGIFLAQTTSIPTGQTYSGKITSAYDSPLGSVTVRIGEAETRSDQNGHFFFEHVPSFTGIQFEKEGYAFNAQNSSAENITVKAIPEDVIKEATLDTGMPYNFNRGCSSPFEPCDGPYHGFFSGYCTDLIFDAYLWGANYNIPDGPGQRCDQLPFSFLSLA